MSVTEYVSAGPARQTGFLAELCARTRGPGGLYNAGNVLGLVTAIGLQFATAGSAADGAGTLLSHFAGSPQALAFSIATVVFLFSGEIYHRAWRGRQTPDRRLNRLGDLLSAIGGAALATSLLLLGQPLLALVTGVLIVLGKLGSALFGDDAVASSIWPDTWPDPFRAAVLAGRAPAVAAALLDLGQQIGAASPALAMVQPAVLIACHVLWIKADLLLLDGGRKLAAARPAAS
jgi:hypothetical protein